MSADIDRELALIAHLVREFRHLDKAAADRVLNYALWLLRDPKCLKQPDATHTEDE